MRELKTNRPSQCLPYLVGDTGNMPSAQWLRQALSLRGRPEGQELNAFGSAYSPEDFIFFVVYPDFLRIQLKRIWPGLASFTFHFFLRIDGEKVTIERVLHDVEGSNKRIRKVLGEPYAKTSIGIPFTDLTLDEQEWVRIALQEFHRGWMCEAS
jgi:hypothetical protein